MKERVCFLISKQVKSILLRREGHAISTSKRVLRRKNRFLGGEGGADGSWSSKSPERRVRDEKSLKRPFFSE